MKKTVFLISATFFLASVNATPQILEIKDSEDNVFDFQNPGRNNGTITYGSGTSRYGRLTNNLTIYNGSKFEICITETSGKNLEYNAWLGASKTFHPANRGFGNLTTDNCFSWQITRDDVEDNQMRFSIWSRDSDDNYSHNPGSKSDYYTGLRYENVNIVEKPENKNILTQLLSFIEEVIGGVL